MGYSRVCALSTLAEEALSVVSQRAPLQAAMTGFGKVSQRTLFKVIDV